MPFLQKRWFQTLTSLVLIFILIFLVSITNFIFYPLFKLIGAVAIPVIGAGILFYLTKPIMHLLMRFKINRVVSILLILLLLTVLGLLFIMYIFPIAQKQFINLMDNLPKMVDSGQSLINTLESYQIVIPDQIEDTIDNFIKNFDVHTENIMSSLFGIIGHVISVVTSALLVPFFLFFMLKDGEKLVPFITQFFEKEKAKSIKSLLEKINETLTAFIQGQLIVSVFVGVLLFIGYIILGLNYSLTLALFAMVMNVIPFLGPFIAVIPALIVGAFQDPILVLWVAGVTLIAQQTESNLISPNVMGRVLKLHPLTVITVILAAGSIAGFLGILFAVPFYAVIKTIVVHTYQTYERKI